jgi:hypothetical protein
MKNINQSADITSFGNRQLKEILRQENCEKFPKNQFYVFYRVFKAQLGSRSETVTTDVGTTPGL